MNGVSFRAMIRQALAQGGQPRESPTAARLRSQGLRLEGTEHLRIANCHYVLARVFVDTPWAGRWAGALRRIGPEVTKGEQVSNFGRVTSRCIRVPLALLNDF